MALSRSRSRLIALAILAVGIIGIVGLASLRADAPQAEPEAAVPTVTVVQARESGGEIVVTGDGSVRPARQVSLIAEVGGRVVAVHPSFVSGGTVARGDTLVRVDPTDYENAVRVAEAEVVARQYDVIVAGQEVEVAREEWAKVQARSQGEAEIAASELGRLAWREPQQALARAALGAAEARLADARARLARATVTSPFDGRVLNESVDAGQYVGPGSVLGVVYASDAVEIIVALPASDAALVRGLWTGAALPAVVTVDFAGHAYRWDGRVARVEGAVDAASRTVGVVVRVERPMRPAAPGGPPLLPGLYTRVELRAPHAETYVEIPSEALREGPVVWIVEDGRLRIRPVDILTRRDGAVLVSSGLSGTEAVVTSNLLVVTDGMQVRERS